MTYGVIVCSHCGKARAVDLRKKTTRCECGSRISIRQARVYFRSGSQREAALAVRQISMRLAGKQVPEQIAFGAESEKPRDLESILKEFFGGGERSRKELKALLVKGGAEDADRVIEELLRSGVLFEPRPDHFRLV